MQFRAADWLFQFSQRGLFAALRAPVLNIKGLSFLTVLPGLIRFLCFAGHKGISCLT
jgi:hypothetical protein